MVFSVQKPSKIQHVLDFGAMFSGVGPQEWSHKLSAAISCKFPVSIPRDLSPGSENGLVSLSGNNLSIFGLLLTSSSQGPLREKGGMGSVYLDGRVMGSSPGVTSPPYEEGTQIPKSIQCNYN